MKYLVLAILAFGLLSGQVEAQVIEFERVNDVAIAHNNGTYRFPWAGGLNNPQFSAADLNNDNIDDLVIFDRSGGLPITFLNNGTANQTDYDYHPEYEDNFPAMDHWMLMGDQNCDGIADIWTSWPGKIIYYRGFYDTNNKLAFDSIGYLKFNSFSGAIDIFVSATDIPGIVDVDDDGDMDVLAFESSSNVQTYYYENQSQENGGVCYDGNPYEIADYCWGKFAEIGINRKVIFVDSCQQISGFVNENIEQRGQRHAGTSILAYDEDGDGDKEIILGNLLYASVNRLLNGGTPDSAKMVAQDTIFPGYDAGVNTKLFAAGFHLDLDNDGLKDMVFAPNAEGISNTSKCAHFYKNVGSVDSVRLEFQTDSFMVQNMIDFGTGCHPQFFDYNDDGVMDIVATNHGYYQSSGTFKSRMAVLENVGTNANPTFQLVNLDYNDFGIIDIQSKYPTFGDLDNDGDQDMIMGEHDGFLHYFNNVAGPGNPVDFVLAEAQIADIDIGQFSSPQLVDVDLDGLLDLIVGEKNGFVSYYRNFGTATQFQFNNTPTNPRFGQIDVRALHDVVRGYARPFITGLDSTDARYVVVGSYSGKVYLYKVKQINVNYGPFALIDSFFSDIDPGDYSTISIADIDNNGKMEMLVGNYRGGMSWYHQDQGDVIVIGVNENAVNEFEIFPNPAHDEFTIRGARNQMINKVAIYGMDGRVVRPESQLISGNEIRFKTENLPTGIYLVEIETGDKKLIEKLVITKN